MSRRDPTVLRADLEAVADPSRAPAMKAYLKGHFDFLGVTSTDRKAVQKPWIAAGKGLSGDDLAADALALWEDPARELQYIAIDDLRRWAKKLGPDQLPAVEHLIRTKSWWDSVDALAAHVVGAMVRKHPELTPVMDAWIDDDDMWIARTAILHQLTWREAADEDRLFGYCVRRMDHKDSFIRKAIGWALRQHGRVRPDAVRAFVEAHADGLSGLSRREALKHL
ncbi:MAG: DNA alkylation repair protein [Myxococcales bacterium]|nr:DNA alkylation repair protein [Myxococcales bacterium]